MRIYFKFTNWLRVTRMVRQTRYSSEILAIDQNLQLLATDAEVEKDPVTLPTTIPIVNYKIYNRRSSKTQFFLHYGIRQMLLLNEIHHYSLYLCIYLQAPALFPPPFS